MCYIWLNTYQHDYYQNNIVEKKIQVAPGCSCPASYRQAYEICFELSLLVFIILIILFIGTTITITIHDGTIAIDICLGNRNNATDNPGDD
jgi:hypothetical protein